ncbi:hypothetical protein AB0J52_05200, partial [Spirillospora sp. NPDC049652]
MSNGARHGLGVLAGVAAIPVLCALLFFATRRLGTQQTRFATTFKDGSVTDGLVILGLLAAGGLVVALLCGSRVSPLASLIAGLPLLGYGAFWAVRPVQALRNLGSIRHVPGVKGDYGITVAMAARGGMLLVLGAALVIASFPPSRWRSRAKDASLPYSGAAGERPAAEAWSPPPGMPMASGHEAPPLFDGPAAPPAASGPGDGGRHGAAGGGRHGAGA